MHFVNNITCTSNASLNNINHIQHQTEFTLKVLVKPIWVPNNQSPIYRPCGFTHQPLILKSKSLKDFNQCSDFNLESFDLVALCPLVQAQKGGHSLCISSTSCLSLSLSSKLSVSYRSLSPQDPSLSWPFLFVEPAGIWVIWSIITAFWPTSGILFPSNPPVLIFDG